MTKPLPKKIQMSIVEDVLLNAKKEYEIIVAEKSNTKRDALKKNISIQK